MLGKSLAISAPKTKCPFSFLSLYFLKIYSFGVQMIYNVVLVSGVQQSDSVLIYIIVGICCAVLSRSVVSYSLRPHGL